MRSVGLVSISGLVFLSSFVRILIVAHLCLECDEMVKPEYCDTVRKCGAHEHCFTDVHVSAAGAIRYNLGCRDSIQCNQTQNVGKRGVSDFRQNASFQLSINKRTSGFLICSECCSGDVCNSAGCGNSGYSAQSGPLCYNCAQQSVMDDCSKIALCGRDEVCMLHKTRDPVTKRLLYESKCENEQKCNDEVAKLQQISPVLVGKKRKRDSFSVSGQCLLECCKTSLCNSKCSNASNMPVPTPPHNINTTQKTSVKPHVTQVVNPCLSNPCHRGTCSLELNTYKCTCEHGVYGRNCDQVTTNGSSTVGPAPAFTLKPTQTPCADSLPECALPDSLKMICQSQPLAIYCNKSCGLCPGSSHWLDWSAWSSCSETCGSSAHKIRLRFCSNQTNNGLSCGTNYREQVACTPTACPVDGHWSSWSQWSSCSKTCGSGILHKTRTCTNPSPANGGQPCADPTSNKVAQSCNLQSCPVDGHWSSWSHWSSCSKTCGSGISHKTRTCTNPSPANGGQPCADPTSNKVAQSCNLQSCPVNGHWSSWSHWSSCSKTCGSGISHKTRTCTNPSPANGGQPCADPTSNKVAQSCNLQSCPVDGHWSSWSHWSSCSKTCGTGLSYKTRTCTNPSPANGGKPCAVPTSNKVAQSCNLQSCPASSSTSHSAYDCSDVKKADANAKSGVHLIELWQTKQHIDVYCDMDTDGGGWTVFQRRRDGSVSFYRPFRAYMFSFGNFDDFWLGLNYMHEMLLQGTSELGIVLTTEDKTYFEKFSDFKIYSGPAFNFHVSRGTGNADKAFSDDILAMNGASFSTYDHDADDDSGDNCASKLHGAWWFKTCVNKQLNGNYGIHGISYFNPSFNYLKSTKMMFRRK